AGSGPHVQDGRLVLVAEQAFDGSHAVADATRQPVEHGHLAQVLPQLEGVEVLPVEELMGRGTGVEEAGHGRVTMRDVPRQRSHGTMPACDSTRSSPPSTRTPEASRG